MELTILLGSLHILCLGDTALTHPHFLKLFSPKTHRITAKFYKINAKKAALLITGIRCVPRQDGGCRSAAGPRFPNSPVTVLARSLLCINPAVLSMNLILAIIYI